jgi:hypothetical protein
LQRPAIALTGRDSVEALLRRALLPGAVVLDRTDSNVTLDTEVPSRGPRDSSAKTPLVLLVQRPSPMIHRTSFVPFALFASTLASALAACNPCSLPTVPSSSVYVSDPSGGPVLDVQVTAQSSAGTVTFNCPSSSTSDAGAGRPAPPPDGSTGFVPSDAASEAPRSGTLCTFSGGLPEGPLTVRAQAPGFVAAERVLTSRELTQPTGCGFALTLSFTLQRQ